MPTFTNPSEIARETLRRLATEKIPPTPDNYRALYNEIAGTQEDPGSSASTNLVAEIIAGLPKRSPSEAAVAQQCAQALKAGAWTTLVETLPGALRQGQTTESWNELLEALLQEWQAKRPGLTHARKRDSIERILSSTRTLDLLATRLKGLLSLWTRSGTNPAELVDVPQDSLGTGRNSDGQDHDLPIAPKSPDQRANAHSLALQDLCAFLLEGPLGAGLNNTPDIANDAKNLALRLRAGPSMAELEGILSQVRKLSFRIELVHEDHNEINQGAIHLLRLVVDNIGELVIDDRWVGGQLRTLQDILSQPLSVRGLDSAERRLREVVYKQSQLKAGLVEAQRSMKSMLSDFVAQLASFARDTGSYHTKIDSYSSRISSAGSVVELQEVVNEVIRETRTIQLTTLRTRDDLQSAQSRVEEAERRVAQLEDELARTSDLVRHDQLTGNLNRRGLDEVFSREIARARRRQSPLCVAVLDVDNFKQLNDSLGHQAGDAALVHLTATIRQNLRPQDTIARYGGEEFVILLPETNRDEATAILVRIQRELTRLFFLHDNQRILITFSAGITQVPDGETKESAIARADELMYRAKNSGKNKVISD